MTKETDAASKDRLGAAGRDELDDLKKQSAELTARWRAEKDKMASAQKLKEQLDQARVELEQVQRRAISPAPASSPVRVIPALERKLKTAEEAESDRRAKEAVTS